MSWSIERRSMSAADFHALDVPAPAERAVWIAEPPAPALVLGSAQPDSDVGPGVAVDVVRRRSGGGAVLVVPGDVLWVDVVVPAADPLWDDDVGRASHWLGDTWAAALAELGVDGDVHKGGLVRAAWSSQVCFAGLGPGEVTVAGHKVVGISQRRTRSAARFQCAALARWDPSALADLLVGVSAEEIADAASGVGVPLGDLLGAFLRSLP
ncbi:MAG: lipoyl protein ligase domain-containing protein [Acidimicrobiales bacterium]